MESGDSRGTEVQKKPTQGSGPEEGPGPEPGASRPLSPSEGGSSGDTGTRQPRQSPLLPGLVLF